MEYWQLALLAGIGVIAGWINVMAGGGSMLTIPAMLFFGVPGPVANGTNRVAILAQNTVAVATFFRRGYSDFKLSLSLAVAASVGAAGGALVGTRLEGVWFDRVLALIMIGVLVLMAGKRRSPKSSAQPSEPKNLVLGHCLMVGAGAWGGFIQIGVGFILMPILHRVMGLDLVTVNMHKVFIVLVYTVVALLVFATQVEVLWQVGLALAVGNATGGWLGARTTLHGGEKVIRVVLYVAVAVLIAKLLFFSN